MQESEKPNLTTGMVAEILGVSAGTLRWWRCVGIGPKWYKIGGLVRYTMRDVEEFIHKSKRYPSVRAITEDNLVSIQTKR